MRDNGLYLDDILEAAELIEEFTAGLSIETFMMSELVKAAVLQKLSVIGEAASRISQSVRDRYPEIDWKSMKGFRNIAVHSYFSIDWNLVWETSQLQVPPLKNQIARIIQVDFPVSDEEESS